MAIDYELMANFTIAMFAIVNPIEKIPLWIAASGGEEKKFELLLAGLVTITCICILLFFLWFGKVLLTNLNIELASFKIGGGLILLQFGFSMMKGTAVDIKVSKNADSAEMKERVLQRYRQIFVPIGVPVIAGPGAITTVIIYGHQATDLITSVFMGGVVLLVLTVLFFTLLVGSEIRNMVSDLPLDLISRVFGMILIALSVQFMVEGIKVVFPGLVL